MPLNACISILIYFRILVSHNSKCLELQFMGIDKISGFDRVSYVWHGTSTSLLHFSIDISVYLLNGINKTSLLLNIF